MKGILKGKDNSCRKNATVYRFEFHPISRVWKRTGDKRSEQANHETMDDNMEDPGSVSVKHQKAVIRYPVPCVSVKTFFLASPLKRWSNPHTAQGIGKWKIGILIFSFIAIYHLSWIKYKRSIWVVQYE
jgi:hypothetical protein